MATKTVYKGDNWDPNGDALRSNLSSLKSYSSVTISDNAGLATLTNMCNLFEDFERLRYINLSGLNMAKVTNVSDLFCFCWRLKNSVSLNFTNYSNSRINASGCFSICENIPSVSIDLGGTNRNFYSEYMFSDSFRLKTVSINGRINTSNATGMFNNCSNITYISNIDFKISRYGAAGTFHNCYNLVGFNNCSFSFNSIETHCVNMFRNCRNLREPIDVNYNNCQGIFTMYEGCSSLLNKPNFDIINRRNYYADFQALPLQTLNLYNYLQDYINSEDDVKIESMQCTFYYCKDLRSIDIFNTTNCVHSSQAFDGCSNLTSIPNFDLTNVKMAHSMFSSCSNLVNAPYVNLHNAQSVTSLFSNCIKLVNVPYINIANAANLAYLFYNCNNLSNASIQNIINMTLNTININASLKNLSNTNNISPFYNTKFDNTYYQNRWSELTAAGWTY